MKPTGQAVIQEMIGLIGAPYKTYDCQAVIEEAVHRAGGQMKYDGSNHMARNLLWLGTLENAKETFGNPLPIGMALFINEDVSETTPEQYRHDGLGDFTHVGLYAGPKALKDKNKYGVTRQCDVVHSSATMKRVAGSTLSNGWTHAGLFQEIDCGVAVESGVTLSHAAENIINQGTNSDEMVLNNEGEMVAQKQNRYGVVTSADGNSVKVREQPNSTAIYKYFADPGTRVRIMGEKNGFYQIMYNGKPRWMMKAFIELEE